MSLIPRHEFDDMRLAVATLQRQLQEVSRRDRHQVLEREYLAGANITVTTSAVNGDRTINAVGRDTGGGDPTPPGDPGSDVTSGEWEKHYKGVAGVAGPLVSTLVAGVDATLSNILYFARCTVNNVFDLNTIHVDSGTYLSNGFGNFGPGLNGALIWSDLDVYLYIDSADNLLKVAFDQDQVSEQYVYIRWEFLGNADSVAANYTHLGTGW